MGQSTLRNNDPLEGFGYTENTVCIRQEIDDGSQQIAYATNDQIKVNVRNFIKNS